MVTRILNELHELEHDFIDAYQKLFLQLILDNLCNSC